MRILVTGGAGFIGSHVVDRFVERGHEVAVLDNLCTGFRALLNPAARFLETDLADGDAVERCVAEFRPEVVDHHAAQIDVRRSVSDPAFDAEVNVVGGLRLLEACTRHGVRKFVYASTGGATYGEGRRLPAAQDHPVNPEAPYGASKHALEHYLYLRKLLHGLDYTVLRYANVYGPRQNPHGEAGVNAIFIGLMLQGQRPRIFGDGAQLRDYLSSLREGNDISGRQSLPDKSLANAPPRIAVTMLVYIGGYGHSGSTLLEYLLTASPGLVACGEVASVLREHWRTSKCTCERWVKDCSVWAPVFALSDSLPGMTQ